MRQSKHCLPTDCFINQIMLTLTCLPQVSLKCRAAEVSQWVFQSYEAVLKNWTNKPVHPPSRSPCRLPSLSLILSCLTHEPHHSLTQCREPLPAAFGRDTAVLMLPNHFIRMVNGSIGPSFLACFLPFFPSNAAERCGSLSWLPLSCPHLCSHHMLQFQEIIPHPLFSPVRAILKQSLFVSWGGGQTAVNVSLHEAPLSFSSPAFFLSLSLAHIYIYWSLFLAPVISRWIITFTIFI